MTHPGRQTAWALLVAVLLEVARAQPFANVSQSPLAGYAGTGAAQVPATLWHGWAITANATGLIGMNYSARVQPTAAADAPFYDPLPGVTTIVRLRDGTGFLAIAGGSLVRYSMSGGVITRTASFTVRDATLDIQYQPLYTSMPIYKDPTWVRTPAGTSLLILGTENTSSSLALSSTIFAFDPADIGTPAWQTVVNADSTNFAGSNCSSYVWMFAANHSSKGLKLLRFHIGNGTLAGTVYDFGATSFATLHVAGNQWLALVDDGCLTLGDVNGTILVDSHSVSSCLANQFRPFAIHGTWFAICGASLHMYDAATTFSSFHAAGNIECAAIHANGDFVFVAAQLMYKCDATGVWPLKSLTSALDRHSAECVGAVFDSAESPNVAFLSFSGYYFGDTGNIFALDYTTGDVVAQVSGNVNPFGWASVDHSANRLVVASGGTAGAPLQSYEYLPSRDAIGFTAIVPHPLSSTYQLAYNASSGTAYFAAASGSLCSIDNDGSVATVARFDRFARTLPVVVIAQYVVVTDCDGYVHIYDSLMGTTTTVRTCPVNAASAPIAHANTTFIVFCDASRWTPNPAQLVDLATGAVDVSVVWCGSVAAPASGFVSGESLAVVSSSDVVSLYLLRSGRIALLQSRFTLASTAVATSWNYIRSFLSAPVCVQGRLGYILASVFTGRGLNTACTILSFPLDGSANMTRVGAAVGNSDGHFHALMFRSGGVDNGTGLRSGMLYALGGSHIGGYRLDGRLQFSYELEGGAFVYGSNVLNPTVLDCGAIAFFDNTRTLSVISGSDGRLAWTFPATSNKYPIVQVASTVYFSDGNRIVGADVDTGVITSISAFGSGSTFDFIVAASPTSNATIVITAAQYHGSTIVFGREVDQHLSAAASGSEGSVDQAAFVHLSVQRKANTPGLASAAMVPIIALIVVGAMRYPLHHGRTFLRRANTMIISFFFCFALFVWWDCAY